MTRAVAWSAAAGVEGNSCIRGDTLLTPVVEKPGVSRRRGSPSGSGEGAAAQARDERPCGSTLGNAPRPAAGSARWGFRTPGLQYGAALALALEGCARLRHWRMICQRFPRILRQFEYCQRFTPARGSRNDSLRLSSLQVSTPYKWTRGIGNFTPALHSVMYAGHAYLAGHQAAKLPPSSRKSRPSRICEEPIGDSPITVCPRLRVARRHPKARARYNISCRCGRTPTPTFPFWSIQGGIRKVQ